MNQRLPSEQEIMGDSVDFTVEEFDKLWDALDQLDGGAAEAFAEARDAQTHVYAEMYAERQALLERLIRESMMRPPEDPPESRPGGPGVPRKPAPHSPPGVTWMGVLL